VDGSRAAGSAMSLVAPVWSSVIGQSDAVRQLAAASTQPVHAYLLVGPRGAGSIRVALTFAASLLCTEGVAGCGQCRACRLAVAGDHPDVRLVQRAGSAISAEQADEVVRLAAMAPVEGRRKVLVLDEFHLIRPEAAAKLLKTIEEPSASTVFVVIADQLPPELVTIASRCVRVPIAALPDSAVVDALVAAGIEREIAEIAAAMSQGDIGRAELLATDPGAGARRELFVDIPGRLDGSGHVVATIADEIVAALDSSAAAISARHEQEVAELTERIAAAGERGSGRKQVEDRHKREVRRQRTDELRSGLTALAGVYRDRLVAGGDRHEHQAVSAIHRTIEALDRNPNEALLLQSLLLNLSPSAGR
jgi:DNA polymerase III subunit delta'